MADNLYFGNFREEVQNLKLTAKLGARGSESSRNTTNPGNPLGSVGMEESR